MEDLMAQFTLLSDQALCDKSFDPSAIEDIMKLFELESYKAWAAMELNCTQEVEEAQNSVQEAEDYFELTMESAMEEFRRFEEEMDKTAASELSSLVQIGEAARKFGNTMEKAATVASEKYVGAAMSSAVASMRSAWKSISSSQKVHPH